MSSSLVSIILPCYINLNFLKKQINSVLDQFYKNFELILISNSDSPRIIDYLDSLKNKKIIKKIVENKSTVNLINEGLKICKGKYITLSRPFSTFENLFLFKMVKKLDLNSETGFVYCESNRKINQKRTIADFLFNWNGLVGVMWRKSITDIIGNFDKDLNGIHDLDYWIRIFEINNKIAGIKEVLCNYVCHKDSDEWKFEKNNLYPDLESSMVKKLLRRNNGELSIDTYYPSVKFSKNKNRAKCLAYFDLGIKIIKHKKTSYKKILIENLKKYFELSYMYDKTFTPSFINLLICHTNSKKVKDKILQNEYNELYNIDLTNVKIQYVKELSNHVNNEYDSQIKLTESLLSSKLLTEITKNDESDESFKKINDYNKLNKYITVHKNIVKCIGLNIDKNDLRNRTILYKKKIYSCSILNDELELLHIKVNKWNSFINKINYTIDLIHIDTFPYKYKVEGICSIIPKKTINKGITFLIRAKNEINNINFVLNSLKSITENKKLNCEIIFVNNKSSDDTYNEVIRISKRYNIQNVYLYDYDVDVYISGKEHAKKIKENKTERSLAVYYNWCVEKGNKFFFIKWDCDFLAITENLKKMIIEYKLYESNENLSVWFAGKTLFSSANTFYVNTDTRYNEFRIFSKLHDAKYVNIPNWEIIDQTYFKSCKLVVHTKCIYLEFKNVNKKINVRDNFRDSHDVNIINKIKQNKYIEYSNRYSFHEDIIKLNYNPLIGNQCYKNNIFNNLYANNIELTEMHFFWYLKYYKGYLKRQFKHKNNILIQGLWVGNKLTNLHKMCVESFIKNDHLYILYTYEKIVNLPENVVIMDANELIPESLVYKFSDSYAGFSDLFRNALLYYKGGWYVDLDIYCIKKFDFEQNQIYSFDSYPKRINVGVFRKEKKIINDKYYVQTNPVKIFKRDKMFLHQFNFVLSKILFTKIHEHIKLNRRVYNFSKKINDIGLSEIYHAYFKKVNYNLNFIDLLKLNNLDISIIGQKHWCEIGPYLNTYNIITYDRIKHCHMPIKFQGIFDYENVEKFLVKNFDYRDLKNSYSIDLFFTMWKNKGLFKYINDEDKLKNTLLGDMMNFKLKI